MSNLKLYTNTELPEEEYHNEEYSKYLSGSELWSYYSTTPAETVFGEKPDSKSFITGSAVHSEVLEMSTFDELYYRAYEPSKTDIKTQVGVKAALKERGIKAITKGGFWSWCCSLILSEPDIKIVEIEDLLLDFNNIGKEKLKPTDYDMAKAMREQMMNYSDYADYIINGQCEHSIVGEIEWNGEKIKVKARPDIIHNRSITNYKTSISANPDEIVRHGYNYGYWMKEYFNAIVFEQKFGYFPEIRLLTQCKKPPYIVTGTILTPEQVEIGKQQFEEALSLWLVCKKHNTYIDHAQGEWITSETPNWILNKHNIEL